MVSKIVIRAFRATEDVESSMKFLEGHSRVLRSHGITKVTSLSEKWPNDPSVFVILVESQDREKVYGGARVHAATKGHQLPLEEATGFMDKKVHDVVGREKPFGTGELCGLWNSVEVAGLGVGSFFSTLAGVVICEQLGLHSLFALCASYTVPWAEKVGCRVVKEVGNEGTFYYPKIDLLATVVLLSNTEALEGAFPRERKRIKQLRENPCQIIKENPPGKKMEILIDYRLKIPSAYPKEFKFH